MILTKDDLTEVRLSNTDHNINLEAQDGIISVQIEATDALNLEADRLRVQEGHTPYFTGDNIDDTRWYNFFVDCDKDSVIKLWFEDEGSDGPGSWTMEIGLSKTTKKDLFGRLVKLVGQEQLWRLPERLVDQPLCKQVEQRIWQEMFREE